jgi:hypothetical protein
MPQLKTRRNEERNYYSSGKQTRDLTGNSITMIFCASARLVNWQPLRDSRIYRGKQSLNPDSALKLYCGY